MNLALRKSSVFTCNLISQSYNILFLALVFSNQTKRKFRVKAWTAVSKELLGVFFVNYKDISMPKNVWNPWVLSVLSARESRYCCCSACNKFDGRTVATSNRKNSKARNWIQNSPKTDESRGLFYSDAGYHMESVYNLQASTDCLTWLLSPPSPPLPLHLTKTDQPALKAPRLRCFDGWNRSSNKW